MFFSYPQLELYISTISMTIYFLSSVHKTFKRSLLARFSQDEPPLSNQKDASII